MSLSQLLQLPTNKGAHDLSYNPEFHNRTKHVQRRHFYVRDMVEAQELVVPLIKTDDNPADFFTKPVSSDKFFKFRGAIMNIANGSNLSANAAVFYPSTAPPSYRPGDLPHSLAVSSHPNLSSLLSGDH